MKNNLLLGKSTVRPVMNTLYLGGARCEKIKLYEVLESVA